jgi:hypothetical protein
MVIKVEGVTPVHEREVVVPEAAPVWGPIIRLKALQLAVVGNNANLNADTIVVRAKVFEEYMLNGIDSPAARIPSMQEQITTAFLNLTGNLDGTTGL